MTFNGTPSANAIRALAVDAVQKAKSGHPGAPMGMAEIATVLWQQFYNHNPAVSYTHLTLPTNREV